MRLTDIQTPALILDRQVLSANIRLMTERVTNRGIRLRPHLKTSKSIDVARLALNGNFGGITVATLNEAEYFAGFGINDITYGVCVTPDKFERVCQLLETGVSVNLIVDSLDVARGISEYPGFLHKAPGVMVEIDCGEHRTGVEVGDPALVSIASCLHQAANVDFLGVFTHAGHSYRCRGLAEIKMVAEQERLSVCQAAELLAEKDIPCDHRSVGSTPTSIHADSVEGITEVRPGVYMFNDLFQVELESCGIDDIALSVLATVISHDPSRNRLIIDAGGLALSKDRSTAATDNDAGFGRLMHLDGNGLINDLRVIDTHQEHGEVGSSQPIPFRSLPIGSRVRILPNHACMTAAMYDYYHVVDSGSEVVVDRWSRTNGWQNAR